MVVLVEVVVAGQYVPCFAAGFASGLSCVAIAIRLVGGGGAAAAAGSWGLLPPAARDRELGFGPGDRSPLVALGCVSWALVCLMAASLYRGEKTVMSRM